MVRFSMVKSSPLTSSPSAPAFWPLKLRMRLVHAGTADGHAVGAQGQAAVEGEFARRNLDHVTRLGIEQAFVEFRGEIRHRRPRPSRRAAPSLFSGRRPGPTTRRLPRRAVASGISWNIDGCGAVRPRIHAGRGDAVWFAALDASEGGSGILGGAKRTSWRAWMRITMEPASEPRLAAAVIPTNMLCHLMQLAREQTGRQRAMVQGHAPGSAGNRRPRDPGVLPPGQRSDRPRTVGPGRTASGPGRWAAGRTSAISACSAWR